MCVCVCVCVLLLPHLKRGYCVFCRFVMFYVFSIKAEPVVGFGEDLLLKIRIET